MAESVTPGEAIALRLGAHHLVDRLDEDGLLAAAGRCAIQDSPPGSALLALNARVGGVTAQLVENTLAEDKGLLRSWCMRGAPFCFPTADAAVFTTGVLPPTEAAMLHLIPGVAPALARLDLTLPRGVALVRAEVHDVLAGRRLTVDELGAAIARRIAGHLPATPRAVWEGEGPYAPGQPLGEAVVHFCLRILTLEGIVCFGPRAGSKAPFVLTEEWLGGAVPDVDPQAARAELLRRYLHCYGPATTAGFAAWMGVRAGDTEPWWRLLRDEVAQVEFGGASWLLGEDLEALRSTPMPSGVRLLPPHDPYTQVRDRHTIVEPRHHRAVWTPVGDPGTVLVDGRIAGVWRPRKNGRTLTLAVTTFAALPRRAHGELRDEAEQVAVLRGADAVELRLSRL